MTNRCVSPWGHADGLSWMLEPIARLESPIERRLAAAIVASAYDIRIPVVSHEHRGWVLESIDDCEDPIMVVDFQRAIGRYRADIHIELVAGPVLSHPIVARRAERSRVLVVEADGHDYHERTKAQASHDRRRDRTMLASGLTVFRFTGSDIVRDARACADEVLAFLAAGDAATNARPEGQRT